MYNVSPAQVACKSSAQFAYMLGRKVMTKSRRYSASDYHGSDELAAIWDELNEELNCYRTASINLKNRLDRKGLDSQKFRVQTFKSKLLT